MRSRAVNTARQRKPEGTEKEALVYREGTSPCHRLPFVGRKESFGWDVPLRGGYDGGIETGRALALIYLKHLRGNVVEPIGGLHLQNIVRSMARHFAANDGLTDTPILKQPEELRTLRGQIVGFFDVISTWATAAAKELGAKLDPLDDAELLQRANRGLDFGPEERREMVGRLTGMAGKEA
jgi:hypothetical protein